MLFDLILAGNLHVELWEIWKNDRLSPNAVFCRCRGLSSLPPPGLFAVFALLVLLGLFFCRVFLGFCSLAQFFSASGDIDEERLSGERSGERLMNVNISNPISSQSERKYDRCLSLYRLTSFFFQVCAFAENHRYTKKVLLPIGLERVFRHCCIVVLLIAKSKYLEL